MTENVTKIKDPTVYVKPNEKIVKFLQENSGGSQKKKNKVPENIRNLTQNKDALLKASDIEWLNEFLSNQRKGEKAELLSGKELFDEIERIIGNKYSDFDFDGFLEEKNKNLPYLHEVMKGSELILPKNEVVERNPVLAERVERLKKEQEDRAYKEMTKNVDTTKKHIAEDTISYQMNMMNRHLIAVGQFLVSVGAGFAFGFLGVELIVGNLNFGARLILGIICALIIAVAEFYFLAKHLNAEDKEVEKEKEKEKEKPKSKPTASKAKTKAKVHKD